jgi:DNA-binding NtrC family response regulator
VEIGAGITADATPGIVPETDEDQWSMSRIPGHPRVLVVDDEALIRWSISETLSDAGCTVLEAGDGECALRVLAAATPPVDVVVLDYRLPDSDSLDLLATIRRLSPASQVIMITAYGAPDVTSGALALGVVRVMSKPFEMGEIADAVRQADAARPH